MTNRKEYYHKYYEIHKDEEKEYGRKYYQEHKEKCRAQANQAYILNSVKPEYKIKKRKYAREYAQTHKVERRERDLQGNYGISLKQFNKMFEEQRGCCGLCGNPVSYEDIETDHNHITEKVRKLTCHSCNVGLGFFYVDEKGTELLRKAIKYVEEIE